MADKPAERARQTKRRESDETYQHVGGQTSVGFAHARNGQAVSVEENIDCDRSGRGKVRKGQPLIRENLLRHHAPGTLAIRAGTVPIRLTAAAVDSNCVMKASTGASCCAIMIMKIEFSVCPISRHGLRQMSRKQRTTHSAQSDASISFSSPNIDLTSTALA
jgi:hypothetical protein